MKKRQQARLDTLAKIPSFLDDYAIELGHLNKTPSRAELDALLKALSVSGEAQAAAAAKFHSTTARKEQLRRELHSRYLRPIAAIANAEPANTPGAAALKCPTIRLSDELLLVQAESMAEYAAKHRHLFLRHRLPAGFVQQMRGTIDAIDRAIDQTAA